jgi:hypothetical protein
LLRFDLSTIPVGVTLQSASVSLTTTKQVSQDFPFTLHRVTADWGEGVSNAGEPGGKGIAARVNDATWTYRQVTTFTPTYTGVNWTSPGGDFIATPSAISPVGNMFNNPETIWTSATLLADVNDWRTTPASNFGWILRGTEINPSEAQRFASRENSTASERPKLTVTYASAPALSFFETWLATNYPANPPGTFVDPMGDTDGDSISNLIEYAFAFNPTVRNATGGMAFGVTDDGMDTTMTATFRRDPRATDLTYELQASDDLITWGTVVTCAGGGTPTGSAFVSDTAISGESPLRLVTAQGVLPGLDTRSFIRLKITRTP